MKLKDFDAPKAKSLDDLLEPFLKEENFEVVCSSCGKIHNATRETFYTVYGNICVGLKGGVVGNNFKDNGILGRLSFFCRNNPECKRMKFK